MSPSKQNLGWVWYFVALIVLSVLATGILIVYNNQQQLKPEQLALALEHWRQHGPRDYHLVYEIKTQDASGSERKNHYEVHVSDGLAVRVTVNGRAERASRLSEYGMGKLFEMVGDNLETDRQPGRPRTFTRAMFDPKTGALLWYVRRVMGSRERMEISFETLE